MSYFASDCLNWGSLTTDDTRRGLVCAINETIPPMVYISLTTPVCTGHIQKCRQKFIVGLARAIAMEDQQVMFFTEVESTLWKLDDISLYEDSGEVEKALRFDPGKLLSVKLVDQEFECHYSQTGDILVPTCYEARVLKSGCF